MLYEPGVREFDAVTATPAGRAAPQFARNAGDGWAARLRRFGIDKMGVDVSRFDLSNLRDVDLRVDLGHRIGTRDWWLGAATITLLCALALRGGWSVAPLPVPARAPYTASQVEDAAPDAIGLPESWLMSPSFDGSPGAADVFATIVLDQLDRTYTGSGIAATVITTPPDTR